MKLPQKISGQKIAFATQQEEERTKFRKKKKEKKKEINLIAAKSGLVGMKGYLETYNPMKYFLPYLSCF